MNKIILSAAAGAARLLPMPVKQALYRQPRLAGLIRRSLNRAAPAGLVEVQVAAGLLAGATLLLDLQGEKDYWLGTYEADLQSALQDLVRPGMVLYDVGANVGYISLMMARLAGASGRVYAFEALPENTDRLARNIRLNGLEHRIFAVNCAVIDRPGTTTFWPGPSDDTGRVEGAVGRQSFGQTGATIPGPAAPIQVQAISVDNFVFEQGNPPPDLVKLDIEGGEVLAMPGMRRTLCEHHPVILLELHGPQAARASWELLRACGYILARLAPGYPPVNAPEDLDWKAYLVARYDAAA